MHDIIIIGGGPAGLTAAVYGRRAGKTVLVIEKNGFGGQIAWSPRVENFPGTVSISGAELGDAMLNQAMEQGADVELEEAVSVEKGDFFTVRCAGGASFDSRALIIAAGARPRMLGLPGEEKLTGSGVCYCAVCDGAFFSGKTVAVSGGGNSALQDAMLLSEKCEKVYLIHRRSSFKGEQRLVEALQQKKNVEILLESTVTALIGSNELEGIEVQQGCGKRIIPLSGLFVAVGHRADNEIFKNLIALDEAGYADSGEDCSTLTAGVFAAGDCRKKTVRQVATACADGAVAALGACSYIDSLKNP